MRNLPVELKKSLHIPQGRIKKIIRDFHSEMSKGLAGKKSSLKMIPTYVDRPSGAEKGKFIALDLGGTNFRVVQIELDGKGGIHHPIEKKFVLQKENMHGRGTGLFDFIAASIKSFSKEQNISSNEKREIGFTFSFPIKQTGIASGILVNWTKDFSASGVVGHDVVKLLNDALARAGLFNIRIAALVNDTVGTLIAQAYGDKLTDIGLILGTGTNACYVEKLEKIKKWEGKKSKNASMIVNIEWGNFNKLPRNKFDLLLDNNSKNKGEQVLEKMVSGMYLGEITRLVLIDLGLNSFKKKYSFKTEFMSRFEGDTSAGLSKIESDLKGLGIKNSSLAERRLIKEACQIVSQRGAQISAAALAAVVTKIDPGLKEKHTIAIDGSLFEKHPGFSRNMQHTLDKIFGKKTLRLRTVLAKDGSGRGAAIIAALASSQKE